MPIYLMSGKGDENHLDHVTRERLLDAEAELQWTKLLKIGWFLVGLICGSILHDGVFHTVEQAIK